MSNVVGCVIGGSIAGSSRSLRTATVGCIGGAVGVGVEVAASSGDRGVATIGVETITRSTSGAEISTGAVDSGGATIVLAGGKVGTAVQVGGVVGSGKGVAKSSATSVRFKVGSGVKLGSDKIVSKGPSVADAVGEATSTTCGKLTGGVSVPVGVSVAVAVSVGVTVSKTMRVGDGWTVSVGVLVGSGVQVDVGAGV